MKKKILIVEDSPTIAELVSYRLTHAGYEVISALDGEIGLRKMREDNPDLVLLDVRMPGIDGFQVCRMAKNDPAIKSIPIIFLTALDQQSDLAKAEEAGVDGYLTKLYEGNELVEKIGSFLKQ